MATDLSSLFLMDNIVDFPPYNPVQIGTKMTVALIGHFKAVGEGSVVQWYLMQTIPGWLVAILPLKVLMWKILACKPGPLLPPKVGNIEVDWCMTCFSIRQVHVLYGWSLNPFWISLKVNSFWIQDVTVPLEVLYIWQNSIFSFFASSVCSLLLCLLVALKISCWVH